jgi:8-hydroxy-5-deazaflavin:NADPH oxidoreductase
MSITTTHGPLRIGVLGAGAMGQAFTRQLRPYGHVITLANSSGHAGVMSLASELGARPGSLSEAVDGADVVFLAIPTKAVMALPSGLFADLSPRSVVIDVGNYHPELRDGPIEAIERGLLDSQWVAAQIGRPVIKAFNSIVAESLLAKAAPRGTTGRLALPVAGDSRDAKDRAFWLVDQLGFDAVDAGDLNDSWRQQTGAPAYCADLPAAELERALAAAERSRIREYRATREAQLRAGS